MLKVNINIPDGQKLVRWGPITEEFWDGRTGTVYFRRTYPLAEECFINGRRVNYIVFKREARKTGLFKRDLRAHGL